MSIESRVGKLLQTATVLLTIDGAGFTPADVAAAPTPIVETGERQPSSLYNTNIPPAFRETVTFQRELTRRSETEAVQSLVLSKHGFHTIAQKIETQEQMDITFRDAEALGIKCITAIQPSAEFLQRAKKLGITVIARIDLQENNYHDHKDQLEIVLDNFRTAKMKPVIQVGNEIDIEPMTNIKGEKEIVNIENYMVAHFIPAFKRVKERGGIILTPPLSTVDMKNKAAFSKHLENYRRMASILERNIKKEERDEHLALGIHSYSFYANEDPFTYVRSVKEVFGNVFGTDYPVYVSEAGVSPNVFPFSKEHIAQQMRNILMAPIPEDLKIVFWISWVHAGTGVRNLTPEFIAENKWWLDRDDLMSFRASFTEVNPVYLMTFELIRLYGDTEQKKVLARRGVLFENMRKTKLARSTLMNLPEHRKNKPSYLSTTSEVHKQAVMIEIYTSKDEEKEAA